MADRAKIDRDTVLPFQPSGKVRHGDVGLSLHLVDDNPPMRPEFTRSGGTTLPGRRNHTGGAIALLDPNSRRWRNLKPRRHRPVRLTRRHSPHDPFPKV
ncbi:hypothetical protein [Chelatococcus sp. YT9]|uniref:hypothetical protein n=1 Tax=Chelatococcus sp. YT9 TaxID=2835635 RepID=UPI0020BD7261|nr:hypothetical protein [Chelatococcus sp. YT9]